MFKFLVMFLSLTCAAGLLALHFLDQNFIGLGLTSGLACIVFGLSACASAQLWAQDYFEGKVSLSS